MVGDFNLMSFASLRCLLTRHVDGDFDLCPEPGKALLEAQKRQPISIGMILTVELTNQGVGSLNVRQCSLRVLSAVEIGDGIRRHSPQASSDRKWDRLVAVILLYPGSSRFEGCVLPSPEDDLTSDGERNGVSTGSAFDESKDGLSDITEVANKPLTQAGLEFWGGIQVSS
jgi:hypothetical protein